MKTRVAICGAGVAGLALAWALKCRGISVRVFDKSQDLSAGTSAAAAGMLAPISEAELLPEAAVGLALAARKYYPAFLQSLDHAIALRSTGTYWVALDRDDRAELRHLEGRLERHGLKSIRVDRDALQESEPALSPRILEGLYLPEDTLVHPRQLLNALSQRLDVRFGQEIIELQGQKGAFLLKTRSGECFESEELVLACGAETGPLAHKLQLKLPDERRIHPSFGQQVTLHMEGAGTHKLRHTIRRPGKIYLAPRQNHELVVGATTEETGFERRPRAGSMLNLLAEGFTLCPTLAEYTFAGTYSGLRPKSHDLLPLVSVCHQSGIAFATGYGRDGILWAPYLGECLAEAIATGASLNNPPGALAA